ncbi:DUF742 domain-containing protein [Streptomyces capparidis]
MSAGEEAGRLVRPFTLTGGRTRPSRSDFTLITLVTTVEPLPSRSAGLPPEHMEILRRCRAPMAVAELSAHLDLPVSVVAIMLSDLLEEGRITASSPRRVSVIRDPVLLQKVRDGLGRL